MTTFIRDDYIADRVLFAADEIKRLRAENAKLRTALERQLLDRYTYDEVLAIARAALEKTK